MLSIQPCAVKYSFCFRLFDAKSSSVSSIKLTFYLLEFSVAIKGVTGVSGGRAEIPCDLTPPLAHDGPRLILFYKDEYSSPIYR